jgi:acetoin utilization protein AcuB
MMARDLMTTAPVSVTLDASLGSAIDLLRELDVRHLPIVNENRELVGMLSDRDLNAFYGDIGEDESVVALRRKHHLQDPVARVMNSDVVSVGTETDIIELIDLMLDQRVGAVPVTDAEGRLTGIVSYVDLLQQMQRMLETEQ